MRIPAPHTLQGSRSPSPPAAQGLDGRGRTAHLQVMEGLQGQADPWVSTAIVDGGLFPRNVPPIQLLENGTKMEENRAA